MQIVESPGIYVWGCLLVWFRFCKAVSRIVCCSRDSASSFFRASSLRSCRVWELGAGQVKGFRARWGTSCLGRFVLLRASSVRLYLDCLHDHSRPRQCFRRCSLQCLRATRLVPSWLGRRPSWQVRRRAGASQWLFDDKELSQVHVVGHMCTCGRSSHDC